MMHDFITFYFTGLYCSTNVLHNLSLSIHVIIFDDHCYIMIYIYIFFLMFIVIQPLAAGLNTQ